MNVLVTGGTGFLGRRIVARLLADGAHVAVLSRSPSRADDLRHSGAHVCCGDITRAESLSTALRDRDTVVHCAGLPRPATVAAFRSVHVDGTRSLIDASRVAGVRRFIHIATQAVVFSGRDLVDADEAEPYPDHYIDPYSRTKAEGERIVLAAGNPAGTFRVASLRPALIWGRGDTTFLPAMVKLALGPFGVPLIGDGSNLQATSHVDNVTEAVRLAIDHLRPEPRAYFIADDFRIAWRTFLERVLVAAGAPRRLRRVPALPARAGAWILDRSAALLRTKIPLARFGCRMATATLTYRTRRAHDELGFRSVRGLEDGLADLREWVRESGGASRLVERFA